MSVVGIMTLVVFCSIMHVISHDGYQHSSHSSEEQGRSAVSRYPFFFFFLKVALLFGRRYMWSKPR